MEKSKYEKTIVARFGWLLLARPAAVQGQFTYTTNNGGITITGCNDTGSVIVTITGLPVTVIGGNAFWRFPNLTSVTIPDSASLASGPVRFSGCPSLTNVFIPNSVTSIGAGPFNGCT